MTAKVGLGTILSVLVMIRVSTDRLKPLAYTVPLMALLVIFVMLYKRKVVLPKYYILELLLFWAVALIGLRSAVDYAGGVTLFPLKGLIRYGSYFVVFLLAYNANVKHKSLLYTMVFLVSAAFIVAIVELVAFQSHRQASFFLHSNHYALFVNISNIVFLSNIGKSKRKVKIFVVVVLHFGSVLLTKSMTGLAVYLATTFTYMLMTEWKKNKLALILVGIIFLLLAGLYQKDRLIELADLKKVSLGLNNINPGGSSSLLWRLWYWNYIIQKSVVNNRIVYGHGFESTSYVSPYLIDGLDLDPHNSFVRVFAETGIVGLILYLAIVALFINRIIHLRPKNITMAPLDINKFVGIKCLLLVVFISQMASNLLVSSGNMWLLSYYFGIQFKYFSKHLQAPSGAKCPVI